MAELLKKLYYDPKTGYVGIQALYQKARDIDSKIKLKTVKDWYSNQVDIQRFQEQRSQFDDFKIASHNPNSWQIDLAFDGKKPILTAININSRLGYAKLLTNKQASTVLAELKAFVKKHKVDIITSDNGSEFMNREAQGFFKDNKIEHYNNDPGDHGTMGKIERFNRTIKQRIMKMGSPKITTKLIRDIITNYNSTTHRSIGMPPNEAKGEVMHNELKHNQELVNKLDNEFEIGSSVIYRLKKKQFEKESARWSKAVYQVAGIDGYRIEIRSKNNHILYKAPNDLKRVNVETSEATINRNDVVAVEGVLDHKKVKNGKFQYLIKWVGMDEPTWEEQANLRLVNKNRRSKLEETYWSQLK